ncbi:MAG: hypothetical protein AAFR56_13940 [Chloroflexota bacterium]
MDRITPQPNLRSAARWGMVSVALAAAAVALYFIVGTPRINYTHPETGATVNYAIGRAPLIGAKDSSRCFDVSWRTSNIQAIFLDDDPQVGERTVEICGKPHAYRPQLLVLFTDNTRETFTLRQQNYALSLSLAWLGAGSVGFALAGAYALSRRGALVAAWAGVLVVGGILAVDYATLRDLPDGVRLGFNLGLLPLLAYGLVAARRDLLPQNAGNTLWLLMLVMSPIPLLHSVLHGLAVSQVPYLELTGRVMAAVMHLTLMVLALLALRGGPAQHRTRLLNGLVAVSGIGMSLLLLEGGLRIVAAAPQADDIEPEKAFAVPLADNETAMDGNFEWWNEYPSNPRDYFAEGNRVYYRTNEAGYRDAAFSTEPVPDVVRVALIGDSFAMGMGVHDEDRVDVIIEEALRTEYNCAVEVYNFGIAGYNADSYSRVMTDRVINYNPDVVLVWYFLNDIGMDKSRYFEEALDQRNPYFPLARPFSLTARVVSQRLQQFTRSELGTHRFLRNYTEDARWDEAADHLQQVADTAFENDITPGLFVHPVLFRLRNYPYAPIHAQVIAAADDMGYFTADLTTPLEGEPYPSLWVHPADSHSNEIANRITGGYAAEQLAAHIPACG